MPKQALLTWLALTIISLLSTLGLAEYSWNKTRGTPSAWIGTELTDARAQENSHYYSPRENLLVARINFSNRQQLEWLAAQMEPWEVYPEEGYLVIGLTPTKLEQINKLGFSVELISNHSNFFNLLDSEIAEPINGIPGFPCYHTVAETYAFAEQLALSNPNLVEWIDIGDSWEKQNGGDGSDLRVLRLTNQTVSYPKPVLFVLSAIHARELASSELNIRFAELLINEYNQDPEITWLLDTTEVHLLLLANPDGMEKEEQYLAQGHAGYWRKNTNTSYCQNRTEYGADLNRNFSFEWGGLGSSGNECAETFRGPQPASEPETLAMEAYLRAIFPDQRDPELDAPAPENTPGLFIDLHSYGELVLWPWGFTYNEAPNNAALQTLGHKLAYFNNYTPQVAANLYPTSGTTDDFIYGELGVAAFVLELGTNFYQDCSTFENEILPNNLAALLYAAKTARAPYLLPSGPDATELELSSNWILQGGEVTIAAVLDDSRTFPHSNLVTEPIQNIAGGEVYFGAPPWSSAGILIGSLQPADGTYDSPRESAALSFDTTNLPPGRNLIYVQAFDAAGNAGPPSAVFANIYRSEIWLPFLANTTQSRP